MAWPYLAKRVHHALNLLCCLSRTQGPIRANELAHWTGIPTPHAAKILYLLTWAGFVSSRRGPKGGFWLRVRADQIRMREVIEFFHPPMDRKPGDGSDSILEAWHRTAAPSQQAFEGLTLADLIKDQNPARNLRHRVGPEGDWRFFA